MRLWRSALLQLALDSKLFVPLHLFDLLLESGDPLDFKSSRSFDGWYP